MSEPPMEPLGSEQTWIDNISRAFAEATKIAPERRLAVFLAALSAKTLRLVVSESAGYGEVLTHATICVRALLTDGASPPSDGEVQRWSSRVQLFLILESLERRGFLRVDYSELARDPLTAEPFIHVVRGWMELP